MEAEEKKEEGQTCCSKGGCCCKAFKAIALLVIGGIVGFFAGRQCAMCSAKMHSAPAVSAPATPAQ